MATLSLSRSAAAVVERGPRGSLRLTSRKSRNPSVGITLAVLVALTFVTFARMAPSPIPRFDNPRLEDADNLFLFGAGREKKIYAVPPHTHVASLAFDDFPFVREDFSGKRCHVCGATGVYMTETVDSATGERVWQCSDTDFCARHAHPIVTAIPKGTTATILSGHGIHLIFHQGNQWRYNDSRTF